MLTHGLDVIFVSVYPYSLRHVKASTARQSWRTWENPILMAGINDFICSFYGFISETETEQAMHYRKNERPEGRYMDLNSLSHGGKPEGTLTRHAPSGWCKTGRTHVYRDLSSQQETDKCIPTDHCFSLPDLHHGHLEIFLLAQTVSILTMK